MNRSNYHKSITKKTSGFTLIELLIALVIVGILLTLAVPRYLSVTRKAKETEAKMMLSHLHQLQESYYFEHDIYAVNLESLEFEQEKLVSEGGKARYLIELVEANSDGYVAKATSVVDFDKDGVFSVWEIDQEGNAKRVVPD